MSRAVNLLDRAQRLQAELAAPSPCPPDPAFATELTLAAQDVLSATIARLPGVTNETFVSLGLASGAIGAGSPVPTAAAALQAQMEADVQAHFEELVEAGEFADTLVRVARTAQMLGMEGLVYEGNLTSPNDLLILLTGGSE